MQRKFLHYTTVFFLLLNCCCYAQIDVRIRGIYNQPLLNNAQTNVKALVSAINSNSKHYLKDVLNNPSIITTDGKKAVNEIFKYTSFTITSNNLVLDALKTPDGNYEVRNIKIQFGANTLSQSESEIVIKFSINGIITDLLIAAPYTQYKSLMAQATDEADSAQRKVILNFIEQLRTAYNSKNIDFIDKVFAEQALIIVGKVVNVYNAPRDAVNTPAIEQRRIELYKTNKKNYLIKLKEVFAKNSFIHLDFSKYDIERHEVKPNLYGVSFFQEWKSSNYNDKGWVFLLVDFKIEKYPIIWVRAWTPGEDSKDFINIDNANQFR